MVFSRIKIMSAKTRRFFSSTRPHLKKILRPFFFLSLFILSLSIGFHRIVEPTVEFQGTVDASNPVVTAPTSVINATSTISLRNTAQALEIPFLSSPLSFTPVEESPDTVNLDKNEPSETEAPKMAPTSNLFSIPAGFEDRVKFWMKIYSTYTAEDAVFHDSQNLSIVYKVVDLRPITQSRLHPFVKEHKIKKLLAKERKQIYAQLHSLRKNFNKKTLSPQDQELFTLLNKPAKKSAVTEAIENLRMQLGQKNFVEKALMNSDAYLPLMESIFEKKGVPKELTRIPFVESSFNLAAQSRVGASGIWQIMPATGRKLMPNSLVDYRNDPIKATEFAATLLKFNYKVIDTWPLAVTAYNHGPTSIKKIAKKYKTKELPEIIKKAYGSHAFAFASSNFYACFLAILEVEKNRATYFADIPRQPPLAFISIQLKKPMKYSQLLDWFEKDKDRAQRMNPHLAASIRRGSARIPSGTYLYIPENITEMVNKELPKLARRI